MNLKAIKRAIILCWVLLAVCFAIKLFGGNWFEIICTNEHFIKFCDFIENTTVLYQILSCIIYVVPTSVIVICIAQIPNPNKKQILIIILSVFVVWLLKFVNYSLKSIFESVVFITMPVVLRIVNNEKFIDVIKSKWYYGIIGTIIAILFTAISMIIRNLGLKTVIRNDLVTSFIMLIDYYIMIVLYYLYTKLKRG